MENISGVVWFYLVPILVFGPLFVVILWVVGLRDVFVTRPEVKEGRRREKEEAERAAALKAKKRSGGRFTPETGLRRPPLAWLGQGVAYATFAIVIGYLSSAPEYQAFDPGEALIKLSLSQPGERKEECRRRTREELASLPPNMRAPLACSRERWPVAVALDIDGKPFFRGERPPSGFSKDGASSFYEKFAVSAGRHRIVIRMGEKGIDGGFEHVLEDEVTLAPAQVLVVGYRSDSRTLFLK